MFVNYVFSVLLISFLISSVIFLRKKNEYSIPSLNPFLLFAFVGGQITRSVLNGFLSRKYKRFSILQFLVGVLFLFVTFSGISVLNDLQNNNFLEDQVYLVAIFILSFVYTVYLSLRETSLNLLQSLEERFLSLFKILALVVVANLLIMENIILDNIINTIFYFLCMWIVFELETRSSNSKNDLFSSLYLVTNSLFLYILYFKEQHIELSEELFSPAIVYFLVFIYFYFFISKRRGKMFLKKMKKIKTTENTFISLFVALRLVLWII